MLAAAILAAPTLACAGLVNPDSTGTLDGGDEVTESPPSDAASPFDAASSFDAATIVSRDAYAPPPPACADASVPETGTSDARRPLDSGPADSGPEDASVDATEDVAVAPPPPALCAAFDSSYALMEADASAAAAEFDRANSWGSDIISEFSNVATSDCRLGNFTFTSNAAAVAYANELVVWVQTLVGCPVAALADAGFAGYALIPTPFATHVFTTADLDLLSAFMLIAIQQTAVDDGLPPLTPSQSNAIAAELAYEQTATPLWIVSPSYTFSTCSDAGP